MSEERYLKMGRRLIEYIENSEGTTWEKCLAIAYAKGWFEGKREVEWRRGRVGR